MTIPASAVTARAEKTGQPMVVPTPRNSVPPKLSHEQRHEAYLKSLELRRRRALIRGGLAEHGRNVWELAWCDHAAQGMKVYDLLTALPAIGRRKAERILEAAGIPVKNTVRACGPKQRERLFAALGR